MINSEKLNILKRHIQELSSELSFLKRNINSQLSSKEYLELHVKYMNLSNLKAIAKNEFNALLHEYRITLSGKTVFENGIVSEKIFRKKILLELDCNLGMSRNLDLSIKSHKELYAYIAANYSSQFEEGRFKIKGIIQLR